MVTSNGKHLGCFSIKRLEKSWNYLVAFNQLKLWETCSENCFWELQISGKQQQ
jgi:hypothetical protein